MQNTSAWFNFGSSEKFSSCILQMSFTFHLSSSYKWECSVWSENLHLKKSVCLCLMYSTCSVFPGVLRVLWNEFGRVKGGSNESIFFSLLDVLELLFTVFSWWIVVFCAKLSSCSLNSKFSVRKPAHLGKYSSKTWMDRECWPLGFISSNSWYIVTEEINFILLIETQRITCSWSFVDSKRMLHL